MPVDCDGHLSHICGSFTHSLSPVLSGAVCDGLLPQQADSQRPEPQGQILPPSPDPDRPPGQEQRSGLPEMCHRAVMKQVRMVISLFLLVFSLLMSAFSQ